MTLLQRLGTSGPALGAVLVWTFCVYLLVVALRAPSRFMEALRSGFCGVPAGCVVLALLLGLGLVEVDRALGNDLGRFTSGAGPAGAREVLSAITTSMITFTGLVFSVTIVVLQVTSNQFSPRVLRTFLRVAHPRGCSPYAGPGLRRRRSRRAGCSTLPAPSTTTIPSTTER